MVKKQALACICIAVLLLSLSAFILSCHATESTDSTFSIIWITDTQYLTQNNPNYFNSLTQWITQNKETYNVKMVVHTGDIVNSEDNQTQWADADQAMGTLLADGVPYCWDAGNHDFNSSCWIGSQFNSFSPQILAEKSYFISEKFDGMNTAVHFNVSGWDCLIVNIAFHANDTVLAWANSILDANPKSHVIIATHAYLDDKGNYDSWAVGLKNMVLDTHANVFLTLSAHYHPASSETLKVGDRHELFFNRQDLDGETGADSARILTFDPAKGTINVQTYVGYSDQFLQDQNNNFTLNTNFYNDAMPEFPSVVVVVLVLGVLSFALIYMRKRGKLEAI
jgi:hypothetical protein